MKKVKILIIGGGPAGIAAAKAASKHCNDVMICGAELHNPYWRTRLPAVVSGEIEMSKLRIVKNTWFQDNDVKFIAGKVMKQIDTNNNRVVWQDESYTEYNNLIIATGANCFVPNINTNEELLTLRYYEDALKIKQIALQKKKATVIGGGLLGLEIAFALKKLNIPVTVVEIDDYLLAKQLDKQGGEYLKEKLEDDNLTILTNTNINDILELLKDSCVVVAAGIRSNIKPLIKSDIKINKSVVVDKYMRTSVSNVFACGDVAEYQDKCYGLITVANLQGTIAGNNAAGVPSTYVETQQSAMLKINNVAVMTIGSISLSNYSAVVKYVDSSKYHAFAINNNNIVAAVFIGDTGIGFKTKAIIDKKVEVKDNINYQQLVQFISEYK